MVMIHASKPNVFANLSQHKINKWILSIQGIYQDFFLHRCAEILQNKLVWESHLPQDTFFLFIVSDFLVIDTLNGFLYSYQKWFHFKLKNERKNLFL